MILQGINMRGKSGKGTWNSFVLVLTTACESQNKKFNQEKEITVWREINEVTLTEEVLVMKEFIRIFSLFTCLKIPI